MTGTSHLIALFNDSHSRFGQTCTPHCCGETHADLAIERFDPLETGSRLAEMGDVELATAPRADHYRALEIPRVRGILNARQPGSGFARLDSGSPLASAVDWCTD